MTLKDKDKPHLMGVWLKLGGLGSEKKHTQC